MTVSVLEEDTFVAIRTKSGLRGSLQGGGTRVLVEGVRQLSSTVPSKKVLNGGVVISLKDSPGALHHALAAFRDISLQRIESRPLGAQEQGTVDIHIEYKAAAEDSVREALDGLQSCSATAQLTSIPHFPRTLQDLDVTNNETVQHGDALDADHPGFTDDEYRRRREHIAQLAGTHKSNRPIPVVAYTDQETATWRTVFTQLRCLREKHACREFLEAFRGLELGTNLSDDKIPQLEDLKQYLNRTTGWSIRPVSGLVSARDFLNGLALKVFYSTQYIRHHEHPLYTPEPDICHEVLGHIPMFCNSEFARFSQEIGLASIGASDQDIDRLAKCYWFSVEFGLCQEEGNIKAYGAGLLSSYGEIEHACNGGALTVPWDPFEASETDYPITEYQPLLFVAEDFTSAREKLQNFVDNRIERPFKAVYDEAREKVQLEWV